MESFLPTTAYKLTTAKAPHRHHHLPRCKARIRRTLCSLLAFLLMCLSQHSSVQSGKQSVSLAATLSAIRPIPSIMRSFVSLRSPYKAFLHVAVVDSQREGEVQEHSILI